MCSFIIIIIIKKKKDVFVQPEWDFQKQSAEYYTPLEIKSLSLLLLKFKTQSSKRK